MPPIISCKENLLNMRNFAIVTIWDSLWFFFFSRRNVLKKKKKDAKSFCYINSNI